MCSTDDLLEGCCAIRRYHANFFRRRGSQKLVKWRLGVWSRLPVRIINVMTVYIFRPYCTQIDYHYHERAIAVSNSDADAAAIIHSVYRYQMSQMDPRVAMPHVHRAVHRGGRSV